MILYKSNFIDEKKDRPHRSTKVSLEELPVRPEPKYSTPRDREKHIKTCEKVIRSSIEYKEYIAFLKENLDMSRCTVLHNMKNGNGKRYRIEIHHEPFTLFDIVETVINRRLEAEESIDALSVADEVMNLHYEGVIGLIPLTITMHELVHNGRIFIPLQYVYHSYDKFYAEYKPYISETLEEKIATKVQLSTQTDYIVSDALDVEFVELEVDGFKFPEVPKEWKDIIVSPE